MFARRRFLVFALLAGLLAVLVGGALAGAWWAIRQEPAFYAAALRTDLQAARRASDELLNQVSALTSAAHGTGAWQATFTAEQINGWLAVDAVENHPHLFPPELQCPRLEFDGDCARLACRYDDGRRAAVLSLEVRLYLSGPNEIALQIAKARAGWLPLPLAQIIEQLEDAAASGDWRVRWLQSDGDPVAAVALAPIVDEDRELVIEEVAVRDGVLVVAGTTRRQREPTVVAEGQDSVQDSAQR